MPPNTSLKSAIEAETLLKSFKGRPLYYRSDGYFDIKQAAEVFGIHSATLADSLRCFSAMVEDQPAWSGPLVSGETAPVLDGTFIWADSGKASLIGFLTQFQTFSMRSLEKKFMKGANRIRNGDVDEALQLTLSMGLSGIGVAAFAAIRGQTIMDEGKRQEFYKNALGYNPENGAWDLSTLAVGALKRSSYMAAPAMAYDTIGSPLGLPYAGLGRTTRETELDAEEKPKAWRAPTVGNVVGSFPAAKFSSQLMGAGANASNLVRGELDEGQVEREKIALLRNLKEILPNDPATQAALGWLMEHGTYGR